MKENTMFYATHKCGFSFLLRENNGEIKMKGCSIWTPFCPNCKGIVKFEMKDLTVKYAGVEIVSFSGNDPEYQCLNGHIEATLRIDEKVYIFLNEWSGRRGIYSQWNRTWVTEQLSKEEYGYTMANNHKCGSSYWNDHCWFPIEPTNYQGGENNFKSLEEVVAIVRRNVEEIARRASDKKYHAG